MSCDGTVNHSELVNVSWRQRLQTVDVSTETCTSVWCAYMQNFSLAETNGEKKQPHVEMAAVIHGTYMDLCSDSVDLPLKSPSQSNTSALNCCLTFAQGLLKTHSRPPSLPCTDVNALQMWPLWFSRQQLPVKRASEYAAFPFKTLIWPSSCRNCGAFSTLENGFIWVIIKVWCFLAFF